MAFAINFLSLSRYSGRISTCLKKSFPTSSNICSSLRDNKFLANQLELNIFDNVRNIHTTALSWFSTDNADKIFVTIKTEDGIVKLPAKIGDSILDVVVDNEHEIVGYGACEGTIACSTCHVILNKKDYENHTKGVSEEEIDLLEMISHATTDTSRLGCQVCLSKKSDGMEVFVPPPQDIRDE